jgi:16S rRNA processing protein RimM
VGRAVPELIVVARLGGVHGLHGEWRCFPETDFPERLRPGRPVAVRAADGVRAPLWTALRAVRAGGPGGALLVCVRGIGDPEAARPFAGGTLAVDPAGLPPLPPGRYYHHQLVGLAVVAADGRAVGTVRRVLQTGANDVFAVRRPDGREVLVPAIRDAVAAIDLAAGTMRLTDLPGLLD